MTLFKGEALGGFPYAPSPASPYTPLGYTPERLLSGVRIGKLAFRKLFLSRVSVLVIGFVYPYYHSNNRVTKN